MIKKDPQLEDKICQVYDLIAEDQETKAHQLISELIIEFKSLTQVEYTDANYAVQAGYFLQWGRCLELLEEPEQACLKWERSLHFEPDSSETLWALASCLIYTMNKPESAIPLLKDKLIPLEPNNEQYTDALKAAELGANATAEFADFFPTEPPEEQ